VHVGLGVVFALLGQFAGREPSLAAEAVWRLLWAVLRAASGRSGPISLLLRGPSELLAGLAPEKPHEPPGSAAAAGSEDERSERTGDPGSELPWHAKRQDAGDSPAELPWRARRRDARRPPPELRRRGGPCQAACEAAEDAEAAEGPAGEPLLFEVLGSLLGWGDCVECCTRWRWRQDSGEQASLSAEEPPQPAPVGSSAAEEGQQLLCALEKRLLECHQLPFDAMERLARPLTAEEASEVLKRQQQPQPPMVTPSVEDPLEHLPLVERAAASEDGHCDPGAGAGRRLAAAAWWPLLCARCSPKAVPSLVLTVLALERRWVWELPWTSGFRLHLGCVAFAIRAAVATAARAA